MNFGRNPLGLERIYRNTNFCRAQLRCTKRKLAICIGCITFFCIKKAAFLEVMHKNVKKGCFFRYMISKKWLPKNITPKKNKEMGMHTEKKRIIFRNDRIQTLNLKNWKIKMKPPPPGTRRGRCRLSKKSFAPQRALNRFSPLAAKTIKTRDMCVGFYTNRRQVCP